jgi:putative ABC transport system permease protein
MTEIYNILNISIVQGILYSFITIGLVISFRFLNFPDLTIEGSFPMGGAISAVLISQGVSPFLSIFFALIGGIVAGLSTALLNEKYGISKLLSGILMMTILYSINLRIMSRPNIPLINRKTVFDYISMNKLDLMLFLMAIIAIVIFLLTLFFKSKCGLLIRAVGNNKEFVKGAGYNPSIYVYLGMAIANVFIAVSGALVAQYQGFSDVTMGMGIIITGLGALIVGESLLRIKSVFLQLSAAVVGTIAYNLIIVVALTYIDFLRPTDLKLATGIMVFLVLIISRKKRNGFRFLKTEW